MSTAFGKNFEISEKFFLTAHKTKHKTNIYLSPCPQLVSVAFRKASHISYTTAPLLPRIRLFPLAINNNPIKIPVELISMMLYIGF
jgi:hypothetical protein